MAVYCNITLPNSPDANMAVTAGGEGGGVTLETYDPNNAYQTWQIVYSTGDQSDSGAVAFVNFGTGSPLSVSSQGNDQQLVMQSYDPSDPDQDAWLITSANDGVFIVSPDTGWYWNDNGGKYQSGDSIILWKRGGGNSVMSLSYASGEIAQ